MREYAGLKTYELTPDYMNEISCKEGPFNNKPFLYIITCLLNRVKLIRNILREPQQADELFLRIKLANARKKPIYLSIYHLDGVGVKSTFVQDPISIMFLRKYLLVTES